MYWFSYDNIGKSHTTCMIQDRYYRKSLHRPPEGLTCPLQACDKVPHPHWCATGAPRPNPPRSLCGPLWCSYLRFPPKYNTNYTLLTIYNISNFRPGRGTSRPTACDPPARLLVVLRVPRSMWEPMSNFKGS